MKKTILLCTTAVLLMAFANRYMIQKKASNARFNAEQFKRKFAISCAARISAEELEDPANSIPLLGGWGNYTMPVTVLNDSARIYFEQGINMYYGFHIIESLASFDKAVKFDTGFAMGYWGKALAYGPNINDYGYAASSDALVASENAKKLASNCTPVEKALINAMQIRYSADSTQRRDKLNKEYADAMKAVYENFPESNDAAVLYADALMLLHPWDLYDLAGDPKKWTPAIVDVLEKILKKDPEHPGASHYYIHAVEASKNPGKALNVAGKLPELMPGVSHIVHMPAHIYIRTGNYSKGAELNMKAVEGYKNYLAVYPAVVNNAPLYLVHNLHMEATCANMDGRFAYAEKVSEDCKNSFDSSWLSTPDFPGIFMQYVYMMPYFTQIRFGKWDDILQVPEVPSAYVYANLIWHYGRGLVFARKHDFEKAQTELAALQQHFKNTQLNAPAPTYANPGINGSKVAENILMGVIAEEQQDYSKAISFLSEAVSREDAMIYDEPKDWPHPARQYLGNVLLKAGKFPDAEAVFKKDLEFNPNNGWSLTGLKSSLTKQGKTKEAVAVEESLRKAFGQSDTKITAAVF
jgi:tetratricopeptide (TPR) repeat protein